MKPLARLFVAVILVAVASSLAAGAPKASKGLSFEDAAASARFAMSRRDLAGAREHLKAAAAAAKTPADKAELDRLKVLLDYLDQFWKIVRGGMAKLNATSEMVVSGERIAIVEADRDHLVMRVAGKNLRYRVETLPKAMIMALVERNFARDNTSKIAVGTYLLLDKKGDRKMASQLWNEAQKSGAKIDRLMPELDAEPGSGMAPVMKAKIAELQKRAKAAKKLGDHRDIAIDALRAALKAIDAKCLDEALQLAEVAAGAAKKSKNVPLLRQASMAVQHIQILQKKAGR